MIQALKHLRRPLAALILLAPLLAPVPAFAIQDGEVLPPEPVPLATLPLSLRNNRPVVKLIVAGTELSFLIDTGASSSVILESPRFSATGLKVTSDISVRFPAFDSLVTGGRIERLELTAGSFHHVSTGTLLMQQSQAVTERLVSEMDGILGRDFLRQYLVVVASPKQVVELYPTGTDLRRRFQIDQPMQMRDGAPYIQHRIKLPWEKWPGQINLLFDTGYPGGIALWDESHFNSAAAGKREAEILKAENKGILYFGRIRFGRLIFANLPVFIGAHAPAQLHDRDGIIGGTMMVPFEYAFDLSHEKLWLNPMVRGYTTGYQIDNSVVYTPGDEDFVVKDFREITSTTKTVVESDGTP